MHKGKRLNSESSKISESGKGCGIMVFCLEKSFQLKEGLLSVSSRSLRGCFKFNSVLQNKTPTPEIRIEGGSELQIPTLAPGIRSPGSAQTRSGDALPVFSPPQPPSPTYTRRPPPEIPPPSRA